MAHEAGEDEQNEMSGEQGHSSEKNLDESENEMMSNNSQNEGVNQD